MSTRPLCSALMKVNFSSRAERVVLHCITLMIVSDCVCLGSAALAQGLWESGGTGWQTCAHWAVAFSHSCTAQALQGSALRDLLQQRCFYRMQWYEQHPWSGREWKEKYWSVSAHNKGCLIQQMSLIHLDFLILLSAHAQSCLTCAWILLNIT